MNLLSNDPKWIDSVIEDNINLFRQPERSPFVRCHYKLPGMKESRYFSCRTGNGKEARKYARERLRSILLGNQYASIQEPAFSDMAQEYLVYKKPFCTDDTLDTIKDALNQLKKYLGSGRLADLKESGYRDFLYRNQASYKPNGTNSGPDAEEVYFERKIGSIFSVYTARRHYNHLRPFLDWAVGKRYILVNILRSIPRPSIPDSEPDILTEEEFELLFQALPVEKYSDQWFKNMALLAVETGLRSGELRHLEWKDLSLQGDYPVVAVLCKEEHSTKNKRNRRVPLSLNALDALESQRIAVSQHKHEAVRHSRYVFPNLHGEPFCKTTISHRFKDVARKVFPGRERLRFHSLRASFCTILAASPDISLVELQGIMGHSTYRTTDGYINKARQVFEATRGVLGQRKRLLDMAERSGLKNVDLQIVNTQNSVLRIVSTEDDEHQDSGLHQESITEVLLDLYGDLDFTAFKNAA